jgi:predicted ATPase
MMTMTTSQKLAPLIFAKSHGNPFHTVQLLSPLLQQQHYHHNNDNNNKTMLLSSSSVAPPSQDVAPVRDEDDVARLTPTLNGPAVDGCSDEDNIFQIAQAVGTIEELIFQKLSMLPPLVQKVLKDAACMGDCINHQALCTVSEESTFSVEASLKTALSEGFLVYEPKLGHYRFAHDIFRQAALAMVQDVNAKSFTIGYLLWTKATPSFLNTEMFVVVNLLNHGTKMMTNQAERNKAAAINLDAGLKAVSLAAFPDACRYFQAGIDFLHGGNYWVEEYHLSLSLYSAAADAELCNQNFDRVHELVHHVVEHAHTVHDKLRAYVTLINSLGQRGKMDAAIQLGVDVSNELVKPLPPKVTGMSFLMEIIKTRIALQGCSNTSLSALPLMQDEDRIATMYLLTNLVTYTFQAASNYCPLIGARIVRMSLKYGMHKWCALGYVTFGFVMCALNRQEGYKLGTLALRMVERHRAKELLPRVYMYFYGLIHHWKRPLWESFKPLEFAVKVGMEIGDVENAVIAYTFLAGHYLYQGKPLAMVETILQEAGRIMRLFRQDNMIQATLPIQQYLHNLTGRAPLPHLLAGDMTPLYETFVEGDSLLIPYTHYCLGAELAYMFGDVHRAAEMIEQKRSLPFEPVTFFYHSRICLKEALICISLVRDYGHQDRRKNLNNAKSLLKQLKAWANDCPENFQHKQHLVEAELKSIGVTASSSNKQKRRVRRLYDVSIEEAVKTGFVEEAALSNELAGDFTCRLHDPELACNYWREAQTWYLLWGATEKAAQLSTTRISYISSSYHI